MAVLNAKLLSERGSGTLVGRYRLERELGRGGTASVHAATEVPSGRVVAIKIVERDDPAVTALFEREYYTLASLRHPRVIEVWDFGITPDGRRYYTMERLPGADLSALAPMPWRDVCAHVRDVAATLQLLHARRLLHRDVSPRNVRIDASGRAKLIDFGTLATFGVPKEIAGTPMCIAPEVVRNQPLDARTDLFSLGVVAYFALTGRKPFTIRRIADAEGAYVPPAPPSSLVPEIPEALDRLVLSLLSIDPMGRPASAAEVIDRVGAIAELDEAKLAAAAEHHLRSTTLVGREIEKGLVLERLRKAEHGAGGVVMIEGPAGMGRSRLAGEVLLEARLSGFVALRVEGLAHSAPGGVLRALARDLIERGPLESRDGVERRLLALERSGRLQEGFADLLVDVAARSPLLVLVDDAHGLDAVSSGALAAIAQVAQGRKIVLLLTCLSRAAVPVGVQQIRRSASVIELGPLDDARVDGLVASVFGEVPGTVRLSRWLCTTGHGNPGQSIELLRDLVDRGVIRYEAGAWVLPAELSERDLPASLEAALDARIAQLSPVALEIAQMFGLHRGTLTLPLCNRLLPSIDRAELYRALDELLVRDVLVCSGESYRLRQEAIRALLVRRLDGRRERELHLSLAKALIDTCPVLGGTGAALDLRSASPGELAVVLQAGFHLRRGGDVEGGRELLRTAGLELAQRGDGMAESIPVLEAALSDYRAEGCSRYEAAYLLLPLAVAGAWSDFRLSYRFGDEVLGILLEVSGLALAARLGRFVGARLALAVALPFAVARFALTERRRVARDFREAILGVIGVASSVIGACSPLLDRERAQKTLDSMRGLLGFGAKHPARIVYEFQLALVHSIFGRYAESRELAANTLQKLHEAKGSGTLTEEARTQIIVGSHILLGTLNSYRTDRSVQATYEELDAMSTAAARGGAAGVRASEFALRGELAEFERWQREVDVLAARAGSTWRQDVLLPRNLWWTFVLCHDVLGLKRTIGRMEAVAREAPGLRDSHDAARACYLAERGQAEAALATYGSMFERVSSEPNEFTMRFVGAYGRILRKAGKPAAARAVLERALDALAPARLEFVCAIIGAQLEHALALAEMGEHDAALDRLETLLGEQEGHDNPLLHGLVHRTFAEVALRAGREAVFEEHLAEATSWFRRTGNPSLIAHLRQLAEEGRRAGGAYADHGSPEAEGTFGLRAALAACRDTTERMQLALDLTVERARAEAGYLYVTDGRALRLAAPLFGQAPPPDLHRDVEVRVAYVAGIEAESTRVGGTSDSLASRQTTHRVLALTRSTGPVVGAIALVPGPDPLAPVDAAFLRELAAAILDLSDDLTA